MRILVVSAMDPIALARLSRDYAVETCLSPSAGELRERVQDKEALVFRSGVSITKEILDAAPQLRLIVRAGSGLDNIDLGEVTRRGIELVRIPGPGAQAVAELSFALMLALARSVLPMDRMMRKGHWAKYDFESFLLSGKTLGVVGAGNIGGRVGQLGAAWGMRVLGCVGRARHDTSARLRRLGIEYASFDEVLCQADFLSLHVPLRESTRGLIGEETLAKVKPGCFLVNTARGPVVDETALYHSLRSGDRLRGAALDVHANEGPGSFSPLRHLSNVILTPHVGASTVDTQREIGTEIVRIMDDFATENAAPQLTAVGA